MAELELLTAALRRVDEAIDALHEVDRSAPWAPRTERIEGELALQRAHLLDLREHVRVAGAVAVPR